MPEDLKDETGAVEHLRVPHRFEVALLYRRERMIDDHETRFFGAHEAFEFLDLARAEQRGRLRIRHRHEATRLDVEIDRGGKPYRFSEPRLRGTQGGAVAGRRHHPFSSRLVEHGREHDRSDASCHVRGAELRVSRPILAL